MFKLTFAFLLVVSGCWAQCTSDSCDTDSPDTQMKVIMQQLEELRLENNKLKTTLEMTNQEFRSTIEGLETANDEFRTTNAELRKDITQIQMTSTASATYFSVAANTQETYNPGDAVKFPDTYTNVVPAGSTGGWDAATNTYTCPITGDYMFVVTLYKALGDSYNNFVAALTRTSLSGADTWITWLSNYKSSSVSGGIRFSSTMQAIVPCRAGEKVWVRADCNGCRLHDSRSHLNTFSGFKL